MAEFETMCPHCQQKLNVQMEWIGMEVDCPCCGQSFTVSPPDTDNKANEMPHSEIKSHRYIFGRAYILVCWIIASAILIVGAIHIEKLISGLFDMRDSFEQKVEKKVVDLREKQRNFDESFRKVTAMLVNTTPAEKKIVSFPQDIQNIPEALNDELLSLADVRDSLRVSKVYGEKLNVISTTLKSSFKAPLDILRRKFRKSGLSEAYGSGSGMKLDIGEVSASGISLEIGENVDFYNKNPEKWIQELRDYYRWLYEENNAQFVAYSGELKKLEELLTYISNVLAKKRLNISSGSRVSNIVTGGTTGDGITPSSAQDEDQFRSARIILQKMEKRMQFLHEQEVDGNIQWRITAELRDLQRDLTALEKEFIDFEKKYDIASKYVFQKSAEIFLLALVAAFLVLVLADYLQAHFDSSNNIAWLCRRKLLGVVIACLFFSLAGCGQSPEEALENNMELLKKEAVKYLLEKHKSKHTNAFFFMSKPAEFIIMNTGITDAEWKKVDDLTMIPIARYYDFFKVECIPQNTTTEKIRKKKDIRYPYACRLTVNWNIRYMMAKNASGAVVHAVTPAGYSRFSEQQKIAWLEKHLGKMPDPSFDIPLVLKNSGSVTVTRERTTHEILWDTEAKRWVLPGTFSDTKKTPVLDNAFLKRFQNEMDSKDWIQINTKWVQKNDRKKAENIVAGKIFYRGMWVNLKVRQDTETVEKALADFLEKMSLNALSDCLRRLSIASEALPAVHRSSVKCCELKLKEYIVWLEKNKNIDDLESLKELMNSDENFKLLDFEMLNSLCEKAIISVNQKLEWINKKIDALTKCNKDIAAAAELLSVPALKNNQNLLLFIFLQKVKQRDRNANKEFQKNLYIASCNGNRIDCGIVCYQCDGRGTVNANCSSCNSTNVCRICNGRGTKLSNRSRFEDSQCIDYTVRVSCSKTCTYCRGRQVLCRACHGKKRLLNKEKLNATLRTLENSLKKHIRLN